MAKKDNLYIANLSFLLDYNDGSSIDEIESEIYKIAFQDEETIHYDRSIGGNFRDLEQEPNNLTTRLIFTANILESVYSVNQERGGDPYIVISPDSILINDNMNNNSEEYLVTINYMLMQDIDKQGTVEL